MAMKVCYTVLGSRVIAENRGGVRSRYVSNAIGSTMALLNSSQVVSDSWNYAPYGESNRLLGSNPTKLLFVGGASCRQDNSTNTYMQNRVLDAVKGRWKTQDPIGYRGGDWNLYRYVTCNPVTFADPAGLKPLGDSLCQQLDGRGSHHCSGAQWNSCLTKCGGIGNVNYCCSGSGCVCITCSCGCKGLGGSKCTCKPASGPPGGGGGNSGGGQGGGGRGRGPVKIGPVPIPPGYGCAYNCPTAGSRRGFYCCYTGCTRAGTTPGVVCPVAPTNVCSDDPAVLLHCQGGLIYN